MISLHSVRLPHTILGLNFTHCVHVYTSEIGHNVRSHTIENGHLLFQIKIFI